MCSHTDSFYFFSQKSRVQLAKKLNLEGLVDRAVNQLYDDRKIDKATQKDLFQSHYEPLKQAVAEGYSMGIEYGTPNYETLKALQTNTAVFAAFKSHAGMKEMAALLKDEGGNLRSREDFKREALKVDSKYRERYLDVEYNTAVGQAQMAGIWERATTPQRKRLFPNFKYIHTTSANPRQSHLAFVGIVRPKDDPFWNTHMPKNGHECKCSVEETRDEATDLPDKLPPPDAGFDFNPGKTGQVFDLEGSNYIKSVPPKEQPALIRDAAKQVNKDMAATVGYQPLYESKRGGTRVEAHPLAFDNQDFDTTVRQARELANSKLPVNKIQVLPVLSDAGLRKKLLPDAKGSSNPDFRIDGKVVDAKEPTNKKAGKNTIQNRISAAHQQGEGALIIIDKDYISESQLYEDVYAKLHHAAYKDFQLYVQYGDDWMDWNTPDFLKAYTKRKKPR